MQSSNGLARHALVAGCLLVLSSPSCGGTPQSSGAMADAGADVATDARDSAPDSAPEAAPEADAACAQTLPASTGCTVIGRENLQPNCTDEHPLYVDCPASGFLGVDCTASGALPQTGYEIKCCRCVVVR